MVHATGDFVAAPSDELTLRTLPTHLTDRHAHGIGHDGFERVRLDVPELEVDTIDDYRPGFGEIVAFANARR